MRKVIPSTPVGSPTPREEMLTPKAAGNGRRHQRDPMNFYTIAEVAELLAVTTRTIRRWIKAGDLVAHRMGGVVRIADDDLRAFLALHRDG